MPGCDKPFVSGSSQVIQSHTLCELLTPNRSDLTTGNLGYLYPVVFGRELKNFNSRNRDFSVTSAQKSTIPKGTDHSEVVPFLNRPICK